MFRERETLMCGRNTDRLPLACPQPGTWPATEAHALTGDQIGNLSVCRMVPNPLSHADQGLWVKLTRKFD